MASKKSAGANALARRTTKESEVPMADPMISDTNDYGFARAQADFEYKLANPLDGPFTCDRCGGEFGWETEFVITSLGDFCEDCAEDAA